MPITKSAAKAHRQSVTRKARNLKRKNKVKTLTKQAQKLVLQKPEEAKALLPQLYKAIDKAAQRGVLNKNTASRKKSRLAKLLSAKPKA